MKLDKILDDWAESIDRFLDGTNVKISEAFDELDEADGLRPRVSYTTRNCRVLREEGRTTITVDVPGRTHKDVSVALTDVVRAVHGNAYLTVKVATTPARALAAGSYADQHWRFRVRPELKAENIKARVENGLLTIVLEKGDAAAEPVSQAIPVLGP